MVSTGADGVKFFGRWAMGRFFRFFFGTGARALVTGIAVAAIVAVIDPSILTRIGYRVANAVFIALGAILGGAFTAARENSGILESLGIIAIMIIGILVMFRGLKRKKK